MAIGFHVKDSNNEQTSVSRVRYPMTPTSVPLTSRTTDGVSLEMFIAGSRLVFRFAQTTGTDTLAMNGASPEIPSSKSWFPKV